MAVIQGEIARERYAQARRDARATAEAWIHKAVAGVAKNSIQEQVDDIAEVINEIIERYEGDPDILSTLSRVIDKANLLIHNETVVVSCPHAYNEPCGCPDEFMPLVEGYQ